MEDYYSDYIKNSKNNPQINNPFKNWTWDLNRELSKEEKVAKKPLKNIYCS